MTESNKRVPGSGSCPTSTGSSPGPILYPTGPISGTINFRVCAYATPQPETWGQTIEADITASDPETGQDLQTRTFSFQVTPRALAPSTTGAVGGALSTTAASGSMAPYYNATAGLARQSRRYASVSNSWNVPLSVTIQGPRAVDIAFATAVNNCSTTIALAYGGGGAESAPYIFAPNTTGTNTTAAGFCIRNVMVPPAGTTDTYTVVVRDASSLASGGGTVVDTWQFQVTKP